MTATTNTSNPDATLPKPPVPRLEDSVSRYLESVRPLLDVPAYADVVAAAGELIEPGSVGSWLHKALQARAATQGNWRSDLGEDVAWLSNRESLVINSSLGISTDARNAPGNQAMRAAQLTGGALDFYQAIAAQTPPPEMQQDGAGYVKSHLKQVFATNRLPGVQRDRIATFVGGQSRHIVVVRRHRFYEFEVIDESANRLADGDLMVQFQRIIAAADAAPTAIAVGVLTAARRPVWAKTRDRLTTSPINTRSLDCIDQALFLVCLDDELAPNFDDLARAGLHGQKGNRWHDKCLHLVIDPQGRFALHGELSSVDAGAWVPLIEAIDGPPEPLPEQSCTSAPPPRELKWEILPETVSDIADASVVFDNLTHDLDLRVANFSGFGEELITTLHAAPGTMLQLAFMLAYYRLYRRLPKARASSGQRTQTNRTASNEALAYVESMDGSDLSAEQKVELLRAAFAEHSKRVTEADTAQPCDDHLQGLKFIASDAGMSDLPRFFSQEIFTRGWELSTAQLPMQVGFVNHFGPACPQGYGIGYNIKNDHINISVTSLKSHPETDSGRFRGEITRALHDMRALLELVLTSD